MQARKLVCFAALAVAAMVATGFALTALFGAPAASATGQSPPWSKESDKGSRSGDDGRGWHKESNDWRKENSGDVEITTCNANALLAAVNQCDVEGDANAFTIGSDHKGKDDKGKGHNDCGCDDHKRPPKDDCGCDDHKRPPKDDCGCDDKGHGKPSGHHDDPSIEATTCNAGGLVALNQCGVDGDATAFSILGPVKGLLGVI
jgi:hypothetical protein